MKVAKQTSTKATYGLCVDPWSEYRICGFSENDPAIVIWDTRNFEKPIVTSSTPQQVKNISDSLKVMSNIIFNAILMNKYLIDLRK